MESEIALLRQKSSELSEMKKTVDQLKEEVQLLIRPYFRLIHFYYFNIVMFNESISI